MTMLDAELESTLISAALDGNNEALLAPIDYFANPQNVAIWRAVKALLGSGVSSPDRVLVSNEAGYTLDALPNKPFEKANVPQYIDRLRRHWMQRVITQEATVLLRQALDVNQVETAARRMYEASIQLLTGSSPVRTIGEILQDWQVRHGMYVAGWPLPSLQNMMNGIESGDMVVIAGSPSSGKTSFVVQTVLYNAFKGRPALIFSMDTQRGKLVRRFLAKLTGISLARIKEIEPYIEDKSRVGAELRMLREAIEEIQHKPIFIDDRRTHTAEDIVAISKSVREKAGGLALIVIDFVQLLTLPGKNRAQELDEATQTLRALAGDMDCSVIALSQLNRQYNLRQEKRPKLTDLRDSGGIEQNADVVIFVARDMAAPPDLPFQPSMMYVLKSKDTRIGDIECQFDKDRLDFMEYQNN